VSVSGAGHVDERILDREEEEREEEEEAEEEEQVVKDGGRYPSTSMLQAATTPRRIPTTRTTESAITAAVIDDVRFSCISQIAIFAFALVVSAINFDNAQLSIKRTDKRERKHSRCGRVFCGTYEYEV
jgi:hypothetical protein